MKKYPLLGQPVIVIFVIFVFEMISCIENDLLAYSPQDLKTDLWLQYRIMYNASSIPGLAGTTIANPKGYEFFRQRMRIGLDVKPADNVGGYVQLEFRGGWGAGPGQSDPRGAGGPDNIAFNRLSARGVRYGYVYVSPLRNQTIKAGILPLVDGLGRILFDGDWDLNVGGVTLEGKAQSFNYRLGYLRLAEGLTDTTDTASKNLSRDAHFGILDAEYPINENVGLGLHFYNLYSSKTLPPLKDMQQYWYGLSADVKIGKGGVNAFIVGNSGKISGESHTGVTGKVEGIFPIGSTKLSLQALLTSGDENVETVKSRFVTPQKILGTSGYWSYAHIFTPQGPSDVNDLGLEVGNGGAGILTAQGMFDFPIIEKWRGQLMLAHFRSQQKRNDATNMGTEIALQSNVNVAKNLNWEFGYARAFMGEFYSPEARDLYEIFSRFQMEF